MARIYKICDGPSWSQAIRDGRFAGSADDLRDGFIHMSTGQQVAETLKKHFAGRRGLVLVGVDAARLGSCLRWEPSRGGTQFPHLYAPLETSAVVSVEPLTLDAGGLHRLPKRLAEC